jgi:hypothetical protein
MINHGVAINKFARTPQMIKPRAHVRIFPAPSGVILIETIDGQQIIAPNPHVAADNAPLPGIALDKWNWQTHGFGQARDAAQENPTWNRRDAGHKGCREFFPDETAAALHPGIPFRQSGVVAKEAGMRHAIAIQKNNVVACGGGETFVEDHCFTKTTVLLPDMAQGRRRFLLPLGNKFARGGA